MGGPPESLPAAARRILVRTGPMYANSVCDALRRRVVTSDGFCPVKKPRVPEEASGVAVGRGRLSLGPTGPTYANSDCDVLRRRVVTSDGFWPVKEPRVSKEAPLIGGHGPGLSLVPEGTAYVNCVRDVPRRAGVTAEGPDLPKKPRVPGEASWVVVGRGRRSRPGPVQSALEGRIAMHGGLYARRRAASGLSAGFAQSPDETRTMSQSQSEIPRPRSRRRKRHISASRRRYKEETGRSASID